jgi:hypothetical protein
MLASAMKDAFQIPYNISEHSLRFLGEAVSLRVCRRHPVNASAELQTLLCPLHVKYGLMHGDGRQVHA